MRERWRQAGLVTRDEMQTDCCYALQDKAWVQDPDGNEWEVFAVLEDRLPEQSDAQPPYGAPAESAACCPPACCAPGEKAELDAAL